MKRIVEIRMQGHVSLSGETERYELNDESFKLFGRALELMYLTKDRSVAGLILEAESGKTGFYLRGFMDAAQATYCNVTNFITLEVRRDSYPLV